MRFARLASIFVAASCWHAAALAAGEPARPLAAGVSVERPITAGETHVYEVPLRKGEAFDVTVHRDGISVELRVECPGRPAAIERGQIVGRKFTIGAVAVAGESGTGRVLVVASPGVPPGNYRISRSKTRPARDADRVAVEAEALLEGYVSTASRTAAERARWIAALEKAITLARQAQDDRILAEDLTFLGYDKFYSALPKEALACHTEALAAWRRLHDPAGEIESSNAIAMTHSNMSEYREAIRHYERAVALAVSASDQALEARVLSNMSIAYNALGEHDEARVRLERALVLRRLIHDEPGESFTLSNLADVLDSMGDAEGGQRLRLRALAIAERIPDMQVQRIQLQLSIGSRLFDVGDETRGAEALRLARELARSAGFPRLEARALSALGFARANREDWAEATALYREALPLHRAGSDRGGEAVTLSRLGRSLSAGPDTASAMEAFESARRIAHEIGQPETEAGVLGSRASLERRLGRASEARQDVDRAIAIIERLRRKISSGEARAIYLAARQRAYRLSTELYLDRDAASPGQGFDAIAFHETERSRARALVESVAEAGLESADEIEPDLRAREEEISNRLSALQKKRAAAEVTARDMIDDEIAAAEDEWTSLAAEIRRRSPRYASLRYPDPISADEARRLAGSDGAIVSYVVGDDGSFAFVLTSAGLRVEKIAATARDLAAWTEGYVGLLAQGAAGFDELEDRLSRALLEPWRSLPAEAHRVVVVPDGPLYSIPFEALRLPGSRHRALERYAISYTPSVTVLAGLARRERSASSGVIVFADPPPPPVLASQGASLDGRPFDWKPLPQAAVEAKAIARLCGAGAKVFLGPEASERRVKSTDLTRTAVLHFATHSFLSRARPSRSALLLAAAKDDLEDGLLQAREIYGLKLGSELVVLSACRTADGRILPGEGVQGLAQAFFHAGARSLVASLWDVADAHTARFMEDFYGRLARGETRADALRDAKLDALAREPELLPRYWAPFVLLGEGGEPVALAARRAAASP